MSRTVRTVTGYYLAETCLVIVWIAMHVILTPCVWTLRLLMTLYAYIVGDKKWIQQKERR